MTEGQMVVDDMLVKNPDAWEAVAIEGRIRTAFSPDFSFHVVCSGAPFRQRDARELTIICDDTGVISSFRTKSTYWEIAEVHEAEIRNAFEEITVLRAFMEKIDD